MTVTKRPPRENRFIAYREYPAPRTGSLAQAAVLVLRYPTTGGCLVSSWSANGRFIETKTFENELEANRYVNRYGDDEPDPGGSLPPDWKWPFTSWYYLNPTDDLDAFVAGEAQRGHPETRYRCQCCGYKTIVELGNFEDCRVCSWEEDGESDPAVISGPNHITLAEARESFRRIGACNPRWKDRVRSPLPHER